MVQGYEWLDSCDIHATYRDVTARVEKTSFVLNLFFSFCSILIFEDASGLGFRNIGFF